MLDETRLNSSDFEMYRQRIPESLAGRYVRLGSFIELERSGCETF